MTKDENTLEVQVTVTAVSIRKDMTVKTRVEIEFSERPYLSGLKFDTEESDLWSNEELDRACSG